MFRVSVIYKINYYWKNTNPINIAFFVEIVIKSFPFLSLTISQLSNLLLTLSAAAITTLRSLLHFPLVQIPSIPYRQQSESTVHPRFLCLTQHRPMVASNGLSNRHSATPPRQHTSPPTVHALDIGVHVVGFDVGVLVVSTIGTFGGVTIGLFGGVTIGLLVEWLVYLI